MVTVRFVIHHGKSRNLKEHLENKIDILKDAAENLDRITDLSENLILKVNQLTWNIE